MRERSRTRTLGRTGSRARRERESRVDRKLSLLISFGLTSTSCCLSHLRSSCSCANYYLLILISLSSPVVIPSAMPQATDRRTLALALALTFISGASSWRQPGRVHFTSPKHTLNPHSPLHTPSTLDSRQIEMCAKSRLSKGIIALVTAERSEGMKAQLRRLLKGI